MKSYQMYVCEKCKKESRNRDEIRLCEAKHLGLNSLDEYNDYGLLVKKFNDTSRALSGRQNPELLKAQDDALIKLMEFEKQHKMII